MQPSNHVYEMRILVRPGENCNMPSYAVGGEALCYVGAPDAETAFRLGVETLNSRGFVCEDLIGGVVGQVIPENWTEHVEEVIADLTERFCGTEVAAKSLPDLDGLEKLRTEGGFHHGPFYCWDADTEAASQSLDDNDDNDDDDDDEADDSDDEPLTEEEIAEHDQFFNRGYEILTPWAFGETGPRKATTDDERKEIQSAIDCFEEALEIVPSNWRALLCLGKGYQSLGDYEESLNAFLDAHDVAPESLMVSVEAGSAAGRVGNHELAIEILEAAAELHPTDPRLPFNLGLSYMFLGDYPASQAALERAIALEPDYPTNHRLLELVMDVAAGKKPCPTSEAEVAATLS